MNAKQITAAMTFDGSDAIDDLAQALRTANDDQMYNLLEKIRDAVRKDTVTGVLADLEREGETGPAYHLIKENY